MSSNDVEVWLEQWPKVAQHVRPNPALAKGLGAAARRNVGRAQRALRDGDLDAAVIWAEMALLNGADAVLQRDGVRVRGTEGAHQARFAYPRLPQTFTREAGLIGRARGLRNAAAYEGGGRISKSEAQAVVAVCDQAVTEVESLLR